MDNTNKKKIKLSQYNYILKNIKVLEQELDNNYNLIKSPIFSEMPRGTKHKAEDDKYIEAIEQAEKLKDKLSFLIKKALNEKERIIKAIEKAPNEKSKYYLYLRYIEGLTIEEIAQMEYRDKSRISKDITEIVKTLKI